MAFSNVPCSSLKQCCHPWVQPVDASSTLNVSFPVGMLKLALLVHEGESGTGASPSEPPEKEDRDGKSIRQKLLDYTEMKRGIKRKCGEYA